MKRSYYVPRNYTLTARKRKAYDSPSTPTPKRRRMTPVSRRTLIMDTPASFRFTPRRSVRTQVVTNLRRRLQRTPAKLRRLRRPALYGAASSKSAGFITTKTRASPRGRSKVTRLGVALVIERGGVLDAGANTATAGNTVAVGHCNAPLVLVHQMLWRAIVKKLFIKSNSNLQLNDFQETMGAFGTGTSVRVGYRRRVDDVEVSATFACSTTTTLNEIALFFANEFSNPAAGIVHEDIQFEYIRLISGIYGDTVVNLRKAVFHFYGKSTLKVQNRTVNATGGDEESVDNVPLYGRAYFGKGSGTQGFTADSNSYTIAGSGFHADVQTGTIAKVPTERWYQEPVPASHFIRVLKTGKVHLDPGHIKTSVLDGRYSIALDKFYKLMYVSITPTAEVPFTWYHNRSLLGTYRFMILEKMLNSVVGTEANSIKCAYEHNIRIGGYITVKNETETALMNDLANIANEA